jgi:hypothetical protein
VFEFTLDEEFDEIIEDQCTKTKSSTHTYDPDESVALKSEFRLEDFHRQHVSIGSTASENAESSSFSSLESRVDSLEEYIER